MTQNTNLQNATFVDSNVAIARTVGSLNIDSGPGNLRSDWAFPDDENLRSPDASLAIRRAMLAGHGQIQAGKWLIQIENAEAVNILTGGPTEAELTSSIQAIHESIQRDTSLKSLQLYMAAIETASSYPPYLSIASANSFEFQYVQVDAIYKHEENPAMRDAVRSVGERVSRASKGLVIVEGGPGSGKSTLLRRIAACAWRRPELVGLAVPHLPMSARLRHLANAIGSSAEERLWNAVRAGNELLIEGVVPPAGFVDRWSNEMGARWLLLLDGFDEVVHAKMPELRLWLSRLIATKKFTIVITTRQLTFLGQRLVDESHESVLELTSVPEPSKKALVSAILDERSKDFWDAIQLYSLDNVLTTPLDVTVAALVYKAKGVLPYSRAHLIFQFVSAVLEEASIQDFSEGIDLDIIFSAIENIAVEALTSSNDLDAALSAAEVVVAGTGIKDVAVLQQRAKRIIDVLSRRSGIFRIEASEMTWTHALFLEFLAALAQARKFDSSTTEATQLAIDWFERNELRQASYFLLAIWSDPPNFGVRSRGSLATNAILGLLGIDSKDVELDIPLDANRVLDVAIAFSEGARADEAVERRVAHELSRNPFEFRRYDACDRLFSSGRDAISTVINLGRVQRFPAYFEELYTIASGWLMGDDHELAVHGLVLLGMIGHWGTLRDLVSAASVAPDVVSEGCLKLHWVNGHKETLQLILMSLKDDLVHSEVERQQLLDEYARLGGDIIDLENPSATDS